MERTEVGQLVLDCLREVLTEEGRLPSESLSESTHLIGQRSVLDSLTLVRLIVELEHRLQTDYQISVVLADERAMSQKTSPFRSVGALSDYISLLAAEQRGNGRA